jgi:hypothetical protein
MDTTRRGLLARRGVLRSHGHSGQRDVGHNEFMGTVQLGFGEDRYSAARARGAAMTFEQITTFALAAVERLSPAEQLRQGKNDLASPLGMRREPAKRTVANT